MPRPYPSGLRSNLPGGECLRRDTKVDDESGVQLLAVLRSQHGRGVDRGEHPLRRHRYGVGLARLVEQPAPLPTALDAGPLDWKRRPAAPLPAVPPRITTPRGATPSSSAPSHGPQAAT